MTVGQRSLCCRRPTSRSGAMYARGACGQVQRLLTNPLRCGVEPTSFGYPRINGSVFEASPRDTGEVFQITSVAAWVAELIWNCVWLHVDCELRGAVQCVHSSRKRVLNSMYALETAQTRELDTHGQMALIPPIASAGERACAQTTPIAKMAPINVYRVEVPIKAIMNAFHDLVSTPPDSGHEGIGPRARRRSVLLLAASHSVGEVLGLTTHTPAPRCERAIDPASQPWQEPGPIWAARRPRGQAH